MEDTKLYNGVVIRKCFSHENMPKVRIVDHPNSSRR